MFGKGKPDPPPPPVKMAKVRVTAVKGLFLGSRMYSPGDIVEVAEKRLAEMFEQGVAVFADPDRPTPTPSEARVARRIAAGTTPPDGTEALGLRIKRLEEITKGK